MWIIRTTLLFLCLAGFAVAETGSEFSTKCLEKPEDAISGYILGYCDGYIVGVTETSIMTEQMKDLRANRSPNTLYAWLVM